MCISGKAGGGIRMKIMVVPGLGRKLLRHVYRPSTRSDQMLRGRGYSPPLKGAGQHLKNLLMLITYNFCTFFIHSSIFTEARKKAFSTLEAPPPGSSSRDVVMYQRGFVSSCACAIAPTSPQLLMAGGLSGMFGNQGPVPPPPPPPVAPGGPVPAGLLPPNPTGPRNSIGTLVDDLEASFEVGCASERPPPLP